MSAKATILPLHLRRNTGNRIDVQLCKILTLSIIPFKKVGRVTPSLPQRGRQPKGCIPLTPFRLFSPSFREFLANLLSDYHVMGDAPAAGAEAMIAVAPKSVRKIL